MITAVFFRSKPIQAALDHLSAYSSGKPGKRKTGKAVIEVLSTVTGSSDSNIHALLDAFERSFRVRKQEKKHTQVSLRTLVRGDQSITYPI